VIAATTEDESSSGRDYFVYLQLSFVVFLFVLQCLAIKKAESHETSPALLFAVIHAQQHWLRHSCSHILLQQNRPFPDSSTVLF
jgi:hypothetical protein